MVDFPLSRLLFVAFPLVLLSPCPAPALSIQISMSVKPVHIHSVVLFNEAEDKSLHR